MQNDMQEDVSELRIAELENQLKQALSDYQSLKRDMEKRLQFEGEMVRADVLRSVIGIADDMDIALSHKEGADEKSLEGRNGDDFAEDAVYRRANWARRIECAIGDVFDVPPHEAVGIVNEGKDGTIDRLFRTDTTRR